MDGISLLRRAHAAGLAIATKGDKLIISGPKRAEALARLLIAHKAQVMAAIASATVQETANEWSVETWRDFYMERLALRERSGRYSRAEAERLAWGECQNMMHRQYGERAPAWQCAGCGEAIGCRTALALPDGTRVHCDELNCVIAYGLRWRQSATRALRALGLKPSCEPDQ